MSIPQGHSRPGMLRALEKGKRKKKKEITLHMSKVKLLALTPPLSNNQKNAFCFCGNDSGGTLGWIVTHESCR